MKKTTALIFSLTLATIISSGSVNAQGTTYVNGYYKTDGTYVNGHFKTLLNDYKYDNYSFDGDWSDAFNDSFFTPDRSYVNSYNRTSWQSSFNLDSSVLPNNYYNNDLLEVSAPSTQSLLKLQLEQYSSKPYYTDLNNLFSINDSQRRTLFDSYSSLYSSQRFTQTGAGPVRNFQPQTQPQLQSPVYNYDSPSSLSLPNTSSSLPLNNDCLYCLDYDFGETTTPNYELNLPTTTFDNSLYNDYLDGINESANNRFGTDDYDYTSSLQERYGY